MSGVIKCLRCFKCVRCVVVIGALLGTLAMPAYAQKQQKQPPPRKQPESIGVRGFVTLGNFTFQADESFDAILDKSSGFIVGGGGHVLLPSGIYVEVSASRFGAEGERAFIGPGQEVFKLGIPVEINVTPIEITGGWRWRRWNRFVPYGGGGFSSYRYRETSDFAGPDEDVDERFNGFHVLGGAEYRALEWLSVGGELAWSSIPDAIGDAGVSAAFNEDNLGGTSLRLKISVGR